LATHSVGGGEAARRVKGSSIRVSIRPAARGDGNAVAAIGVAGV